MAGATVLSIACGGRWAWHRLLAILIGGLAILDGPLASAAVRTSMSRAAERPPDARSIRYRNLAVQEFSDLRARGTLVTRRGSGALMSVKFSFLSKMDDDGASRRVLTWVSAGGPFERAGSVSVEAHGKAKLWTYHPTARRARRNAVSNLDGSYLESEFRYRDVIRPRAESTEDEAAAVLGETTADGRRYWIISVAPAWRAPGSGCSSRQLLWIRQDTFVERRIERYDCHGVLETTMNAERWSHPGPGRGWFALERNIRNVQTGISSQIVFEDVDATHSIPVSTFAPHHLPEAGW